MAEKTDIQLFENSNNNAYAAWSPDGRYIIYSSDETKVYNLFAWSIKEGKSYQITHILGGAFQPDISPKGTEMVFSVYGSKGYKMAVIKYNPEGWMTSPGPAIKPYWKEDTDLPPPLNPLPQGEGRYLGENPKPYSAVPTLLPHFWLPAFSGDHKGTVVGAFTAGQDVLGYNTYTAQIGYGTSSDNVYYDINYLNDYAYPTLILQTYERPVVYSGLLPGGDYYELNRSLLLGMSVPINRIESKYRFTLGYHMQDLDKLSMPLSGGNLLFAGRKDNLFAGVEFSNSLKYPYSISHEEGRKITLLHRYYSKETGSDLISREYIASYTEYIKLPTDYLRHHVAYINLTGAASYGERTRQGAFQIGGTPSINQTGYPLRGYRPGFAVGQYLATGTLEYRVPLKYIFQGNGTRPVFWDRLHGALFADAGEVWDDNTGFTSDRLKVGAGVEARLDMTLGYWLRITPALGLAHGFNKDGETTGYLTIYINL
ncbi:MAG: repeat-containing protein, partial [Deltaproteobacteria bacterium]|nr:repeat-containing protein [Deltaproteobacteria bacterium]